MLETRLYTFGGFTAVAPVRWTGPDQSVQRGPSATRVKWGELRGWAFHSLAKGQPALAYLISTVLPDDMPGATLVAVEDAGERLWYAAVFRAGKPVEGTETVFDDATAFENHLHSIARTSEVHHCALSRSIVERLPELWDGPTVIEPGMIDPEGAPRFASPLTISSRAIKRIKVAAGALAASALIGVGAWAALAPKADLPAVLVTVHKAKSVVNFVNKCSGALSTEWPQPLNWDVTTSGCFDNRLATNADVKAANADAGAYRVYKLNGGYNPQNARIIARHALSAWDQGEYVIADTTLTLVIPFANPTEYVDPPVIDPAPLIDDVEQVFVGTVESIRRNPSSGDIVIRTQTTPQKALERVLGVERVEVRAIKATGGVTELTLGPLTVSQLKEVAKQ